MTGAENERCWCEGTSNAVDTLASILRGPSFFTGKDSQAPCFIEELVERRFGVDQSGHSIIPYVRFTVIGYCRRSSSLHAGRSVCPNKFMPDRLRKRERARNIVAMPVRRVGTESRLKRDMDIIAEGLSQYTRTNKSGGVTIKSILTKGRAVQMSLLVILALSPSGLIAVRMANYAARAATRQRNGDRAALGENDFALAGN